jgi:hypothetical protein
MMLCIDGTLHIVTDHSAASTTCGHRSRIGIGQRYLFVFGLHHLDVQCVQALNLLTQRRNLLVEPGDLGFRYCFPLAIGAVELREIAGYALVNLRQPPLHLGLGEVPVPRVDGLELAAIDRNARLAEQLKASAQHHELAADLADGYGHRQRQSASSNPPAKSRKNHIIGECFHTAWVISRQAITGPFDGLSAVAGEETLEGASKTVFGAPFMSRRR